MRFLLFATIVAFFLALFLAKKETLSRKSKIVIVLLVGHAIMFGWIYEYKSSQERENHRDILNAFKQSKVIYCGELAISSKDFFYVSGTLTFMPNDKNAKQKGLVIDIATCRTEK